MTADNSTVPLDNPGFFPQLSTGLAGPQVVHRPLRSLSTGLSAPYAQSRPGQRCCAVDASGARSPPAPAAATPRPHRARACAGVPGVEKLWITVGLTGPGNAGL